jgi:cytochrome c oxidase cbb3-type subunit I
MDAPSPSAPRPEETALRAAIDRSVRWPVLFFHGSGLFWLLAALATGFLANWKLAWPGGPEASQFFTYARLHPVHVNLLVYGWGFNMAFGTALWLLARLCRQEARGIFTYMVAGKAWNSLVAIGCLAVILGHGSGVEWLEFPRWVWPAMFLCYAVIAAKLFVILLRRPLEHTFISVWYLAAALLAFPWLLLTAWLVIFAFPGAAVMGAAANHWYIGGVQSLFFIPVGLAAIHYFLPKITGRVIHSQGLATAGFWGIIGLGGWTGMQTLLGGPLPAWMPVISGAAMICLLVPGLLGVFLNLKVTVKDEGELIENSPTLRFSYAALWAFAVVLGLGALLSLAKVGWAANFSQAQTGYTYAVVGGFFTLAMWSAVMFITPRITGCEWPSGKSLRMLFWFTIYPVIMLVFLGVAGGVWQGSGASSWEAGWLIVVDGIQPYVRGRLFAFLLLFAVNLAFLRVFLTMVLRLGRPPGKPTLIYEPAGDSTPAPQA